MGVKTPTAGMTRDRCLIKTERQAGDPLRTSAVAESRHPIAALAYVAPAEFAELIG
jgi:hypothetical protein